jgi:hypothetical protein
MEAGTRTLSSPFRLDKAVPEAMIAWPAGLGLAAPMALVPVLLIGAWRRGRQWLREEWRP